MTTKTTKRAVAYVSDIVLGQTGEVISREAQKEAIRKHAADGGIEIVEFYEDEVYDEDIMARPGIQRLLGNESAYDCVLVERVWTLSRQWDMLVVFLKEIQRRGRKLESAACLWDCVSQQARHYFRPGYKPLGQAAVCAVPALEQVPAAAVAKPARLNFVFLKRRPVNA
jgi:hypothetical protein